MQKVDSIKVITLCGRWIISSHLLHGVDGQYQGNNIMRQVDNIKVLISTGR
jgi:hypothetical protein